MNHTAIEAIPWQISKELDFVDRFHKFIKGARPALALAERFDNARLPNNWERFILSNGSRCITAPAKYPIAVNGFITGLNSSPIVYQDETGWIGSQGISTVGLALPEPDLSLDAPERIKKFIGEALAQVEVFCFDKNSPLHTAFDPDLPRVITTHSSAGLFLSHLLRLNPRGLDGRVKSITHVNPFFGIPQNMFTELLFYEQAGRALNTRTDETLAGRIYGAFWNPGSKDPDYCFTPSPTYGDIVGLQAFAKEFIKDLKATPSNQPCAIPQTFILSKIDRCASAEKGREVANLLGAKVIYCDKDAPRSNPDAFRVAAAHWPMRRYPQVLRRWADNVHAATAQPAYTAA